VKAKIACMHRGRLYVYARALAYASVVYCIKWIYGSNYSRKFLGCALALYFVMKSAVAFLLILLYIIPQVSGELVT